MQKYTFSFFLADLEKRPALAAALSMLMLCCIAEKPSFLPALLPIWLLFAAALPPFARRASLALSLVGLLIRIGIPESSATGMPAIPLPAHGEALVLESRPRSQGVTIHARIPTGDVQWSWKGTPLPRPGDRIRWHGHWFPVNEPTTPGAFDTPGWMRARGLLASGALDSLTVLESRWTWQRHVSSFHEWLRKRLDRAFAPGESGLLMGLLVGDRSRIDEALQNDFQRTGLVHVLAISGYHVVLLAGFLTLFLRSLRLPHWLARVLAMLALMLYIPVAGASAPVCRAVLMFLVMESSWIFQRRSDSLNALGVAVVLLLLWEPRQWSQIGFQLSSAATAGILLGQHLPWKPASRKRRGFASLFHKLIVEPSWVTLCATISTLPLLVFHFQNFAPVAWLGNLIVVPLMGLGMQAGILSLLMPAQELLFQPFADAATLLFRLSGMLTAFLADGPGASMTLGPWPLPCLWAALIFVGLLPTLHMKCPWGRRIALAALLTCGGFYAWSGLQQRLQPEWSITALDVGQGDCLLVKSPGGRFYLVDTGPPQHRRSLARDRIVPYLRSIGVSRLEALVITHPDADHYGNAREILELIPVRSLWTTACARSEKKSTWQQTLQTAAARRIPIRNLHRGLELQETLRWGKSIPWRMTVLHPDTLFCPGDVNTHSIVLRVEGNGGSALLTGDLTEKGEDELKSHDIRSTLLKLGHHGSKTSSSPPFLKRVQPQHGWISSGRNNRYRHPHPLVLQRLDSLKIPWYNTAESGTLQIRFQKKGHTLWHYQGKWKPIISGQASSSNSLTRSSQN